MSEDDLSRRDLLARGAAGALLVGLGTPAAADDEEDERKAIVALPLSEYHELAKVGGWTTAELADGTEVLVARVEEDRFVCLSLKCTHANCNVEYDPRGKRIICPCHRSSYDLDGKPTSGPAPRPLKSYKCELAVVIRPPK